MATAADQKADSRHEEKEEFQQRQFGVWNDTLDEVRRVQDIAAGKRSVTVGKRR